MRERLERNATLLLVGAAITMALICAAIIVSGWFAGAMDDPPERWFWAGSVLEFVMVAVFVAAAFPGGDDDAAVIRRVRALTRVGLVLFILAPAICIGRWSWTSTSDAFAGPAWRPNIPRTCAAATLAKLGA
jgi:hypothetical protein